MQVQVLESRLQVTEISWITATSVHRAFLPGWFCVWPGYAAGKTFKKIRGIWFYGKLALSLSLSVSLSLSLCMYVYIYIYIYM